MNFEMLQNQVKNNIKSEPVKTRMQPQTAQQQYVTLMMHNVIFRLNQTDIPCYYRLFSVWAHYACRQIWQM